MNRTFMILKKEIEPRGCSELQLHEVYWYISVFQLRVLQAGYSTRRIVISKTWQIAHGYRLR